MIEPSTATGLRFSLQKLFCCVAVFAGLFGIIGGLPMSLVQIAAATGVVTLFVILDLASSRPEFVATPAWARYSQFVAYYATAFAISVAVGYWILLLAPKPPVPPKPALPLIADLYLSLAGKFLVDFRSPIGLGMATSVVFFELYMLLSTITFLLSPFAMSHFRSAKWLAMISSPGALLFAGCVTESFFRRK